MKTMERKYDLKLMDTDPAPGGSQPAAQSQQQQAAGGKPAYSFEQAEEIANARADRAVKASLGDYFRRQGLSEEQVTEAIADYKARQAAKQPNVDAITKERDDALAKLETLEQAGKLREKGVRDTDADYVLFKVRGMMSKDSKLDFDKAVDAFLKDNPRFTKAAASYKVTQKPGTDGKDGKEKQSSAEIISALRATLGRK